MLLAQEFDVETHSGTNAQILTGLADFRPHLVVLDVRGPEVDLPLLVRAIRSLQPEVAMAIVAGDLPDDAVLEAIRLDVTGLVMANASPEAIVRCVREVHSGQVSLDQRALVRVVKSVADRQVVTRELAKRLTARELEIVSLVGRGLTNREIAAELVLVEGTVKVHLHHVFRKLRFSDRKTLAAYAREKGLV